MLNDQEIENIIKSYVEKTEKLGEQSGGSGHQGFVSYNILKFESVKLPEGNLRITFYYTISVETEFTYYPDNPPTEITYEKEIIIDKKEKIISEKIVSVTGNYPTEDLMDSPWEGDKMKILIFIEELLAKIEWRFGENRAPIKYPPKFLEENGKFICSIELEDYAGDLVYKSDNSTSLVDHVIDDLCKKYLPK